MARDEALLAACGPNSPITLRFYGWSPATISLGYFQEYGDYERIEPPAGWLPVVRRTTGGGAILHDLEVTYSIVLPVAHSFVRDKPNNLYAAAHRAIILTIGHGLQMVSCSEAARGESGQRGPFLCFARRHALDVLLPDSDGIGGFSKLAGSAQRRTMTAILQHGSIMLSSRFAQQPVATWSALAGVVTFEVAVSRLIPAFEEELGVAFEVGAWSADELASAKQIEQKYAGDAWTKSRVR